MIRRIGQSLLVLLIAYTLAFLLLDALPSDGVAARFASPDLGLSAAELAQIREATGIDQSLPVRYLDALGGFATFDFGYSTQTGTAVSRLLGDALPTTIALAAAAFALAAVVALALAGLATFPRFHRLAELIRSLPALLISVPTFWLGVILLQLFSFQLGWVSAIDTDGPQAWLLPVITLAVPVAAPLAQVLIRAIDEVTARPFVDTVRARGAGDAWLFLHTIARNAMLPTLTIAGLLFGDLVGGAVVVESVFGINGVGALTVDAVSNRDTPVLLAVVIVAATTYVLINLIVDLTYPVLDPRLRKKAQA